MTKLELPLEPKALASVGVQSFSFGRLTSVQSFRGCFGNNLLIKKKLYYHRPIIIIYKSIIY
ncbi:MAG: hypothetical protein DRR08_11910 [Candidatus Parabeggiatoa sp. nov. 2]|nr:MAG: hypothetical protein B6247_15270 [Beggiatoa sp. 4572_84]RKZ60227.1 MAG: hypothetical protein DRR08_11910 [Gammaproteobacteria bacterium]